MKSLSALIVNLLVLILLASLSYASKPLRISVSIYPLSYFCLQIGGDVVKVNTIIPAGTEPHSFEPTPRTLTSVLNSALFITNGFGIDRWTQKIIADAEAHNVKVIRMSDYLSGLSQDPQTKDPHIWLDPLLAIREVEILLNAFTEIDPDNKDTYIRNGNLLTGRLNVLHDSFMLGLSNCKKRDIIVSHDAYRYLAARYNITTHPISGISPEEEPSAKKLSMLAKIARAKDIRHIFFDELSNKSAAEVLAKEIGADMLKLHPLGQLTRSEIDRNMTYISIMKKNLDNLRMAMECQ